MITLIFEVISTGGAQTTNSRSIPANGLGLSDLERIAGSMADLSLINQMMQNPAMTHMMQSLLSNPQFMNQVVVPCSV